MIILILLFNYVVKQPSVMQEYFSTLVQFKKKKKKILLHSLMQPQHS